MKRLVLATKNRDKERELEGLIRSLDVVVETLAQYPQVGEIPEDGATLAENALKKARTVFRTTGVPALADDTGLEVYYLRGEPGVFSARYSGEGATYESNCNKLLRNMLGVAPRRRRARFRSVIAFVTEENEATVEGVCEGRISESPSGSNGFGYDSVFIPDGESRTFAEMDSAGKNRISHRGKALSKIIPLIEAYFREK